MKTYPPASNFYVGEEVIPPDAAAAGGAGISGITITDEGVTVGAAAGITSIDFTGAAVVASGAGAAATVAVTAMTLGQAVALQNGLALP